MASPRMASPLQEGSPKMGSPRTASPKMTAPLITVAETPEMDSYFSQQYTMSADANSLLATPTTFRSRLGSVGRGPARRQSVVTNVVIPTHLLNAVSGSAQFSSVGQEIKRRQSCMRSDPREQFDAAAFANTQSAAVLRAMGKETKSKSRSSSISVGRRKMESRRPSGIDPGTPSSRHGVNPANMLAVPGTIGIPGTPGTPRSPGTPGTTGGILRRPSAAGRWEPTKLQLPSPSLVPPPPAPALVRKKSMVTFSESPAPSEKVHAHRKKSVVTFSSPNHSAFHTPTTQTPLSEVPPALRAKSIASYTEVRVEIGDADETDVKSALSEDYFGDYSLTGDGDPPRSHSNGRGPLDTPGSSIPETLTGRPTGWRWGGNRTSISGSSNMRSQTRRNTSINAGRALPRRASVWQRSKSVFQDAVDAVVDEVQNATDKLRRNTMDGLYANAIARHVELQRSKWFMIFFEWTIYVLMIAFVYFVFVGTPIWRGTAYWLWYAMKYKLPEKGTGAIISGLAIFYAFSPLLVFFEPDPPPREDVEKPDPNKTPGVEDTCLLIPCYKSENIIGATLASATQIFPPSHIFVVANGNSPSPLDGTEGVCMKYGVNHIWSPVGSKIVAQFVGCFAAKGFKNVLLIDDDCALPPNFPIVSDQLKDNVMCMGYTIKSVGPHSSRGTLAQQAQDMEYKLSGIQRALAGKLGSALFPHGAISLWDREFLIKTFHQHPGFSVSEDWFFGHVARELGCRTKMCTSVFIETETPSAIFFTSGGSRGGFGEMTVFKQRFTRWNFFFVNGMYYNLVYILFSWKLGWCEIFTKILCFQEIYETLLYLATPLVLPVTFSVRPLFCTYLLLATFGLYFLNVIIFNEIHLRRKRERVPTFAIYVYYMPYKIILTFVNVASCYYALFKYATYFAKRHPKVIEDERAVGVVLQLEESIDDESILTSETDDSAIALKHASTSPRLSLFPGSFPPSPISPMKPGRRMTVTAIGAQTQIDTPVSGSASGATTPIFGGGFSSSRRMTVTTLGPRLDIQAASSGCRKPSVDTPATLSVGGRKYSVPSLPGTEGMRRLSSSGFGLASPGQSTLAAPSFYTARSAARRLSDEGLDPHSPSTASTAAPSPAFVLGPAPKRKKGKLPTSAAAAARAAEANTAALPSPSGSGHTATSAVSNSRMPLQAHTDPLDTPRSDSQNSGGNPPSTGRGRLFSVAEVEDDSDDAFEDAAEDLTRRSGSLARMGLGGLVKVPSRGSERSGVRRKSSTVHGIVDAVRRASLGRKKSWVGSIRGRRKSRAMSRGGGEGSEEVVPPYLLDQLAGVQVKLARNRVEVVDWSIDDVFRKESRVEDKGGERRKTEDARSPV